MGVTTRPKVIHFINRMELQVNHFAYGTYPEAQGVVCAMPCNRILLPESGNPKGCLISDKKTCFQLQVGNLYFIPCFHETAVTLNKDLFFLSIQFRLELTKGVDLFPLAGSIYEIPAPDFLKQINQIYQIDDPFSTAFQLKSQLLTFCDRLIRTVPVDPIDGSVKFVKYQRVLDFVNRHALSDTTVQDLAEIQGMRRETFTRKFTKDIGVPPKQFLTRAIFSKAGDLLLRTDMSVKEIAEKLRFNNEYYFSCFFRKQAGIPPQRFRKISI